MTRTNENSQTLPYKIHPLGFEMPVALIPDKKQRGALIKGQNGNPAIQKTKDGRIMYALPGGGRYVE